MALENPNAVVLDSAALAAEVINDTDDHPSASVDVRDYQMVSWMVNHADTLSPGNIQYRVQFSNDGTNWFAYQQEGWALRQVSESWAADEPRQAYTCRVRGIYCRLVVDAPGADGTNYWTVTAEAVGIRAA